MKKNNHINNIVTTQGPILVLTHIEIRKTFLFLITVLISSITCAQTNIFTSMGNVGIGTTNPTQGLQVISSNPSGSFGTFSSSGGQGLSINPNNTIGTVNLYSDYLTGGPEPSLHFSTYANRQTAEGITITPSGSVGIGTTNPMGYKLAINGSVIATSIKVELYEEWPDFVFCDNYRLPPLAEVRKYITKNHRLPDIPSAEEVSVSGLDLAKVTRTLTQKVEELTLYLLEKDTQVQQLKEKIFLLEEQQAKNKQQESRIAALEEVLSKITQQYQQ